MQLFPIPKCTEMDSNTTEIHKNVPKDSEMHRNAFATNTEMYGNAAKDARKYTEIYRDVPELPKCTELD